MKPILNIAAYLFVSLDALPELRAKMLDECNTRELKGTILLTGEGINMFLAGLRHEIDAYMDWLHSDPRFADIVAKERESLAQLLERKASIEASLAGQMTAPYFPVPFHSAAARVDLVDLADLVDLLDLVHLQDLYRQLDLMDQKVLVAPQALQATQVQPDIQVQPAQ